MDSIDKHSDDRKQNEKKTSSLPFGIAQLLQIEQNSTKQRQNSSSFTVLANASNWCARCSIHFRLTSDLVQHIRIYHAKRYETSPYSTNKSSISLQCQICHETFRQRHHLTRHMTSHR